MKTVKKVFLFIFVILLSASFVVYLGGGTDQSLTPTSQEVGRIGSHIIKNSQDGNFARNYRKAAQKYQELTPNLGEEQVSQYIIQEAFFETLIDYLIDKESEQDKITVSDEQLLNAIIDSHFSGDVREYQKYLNDNGTQELKRLEEGARLQALRKIYLDNLTRGVLVSKHDLQEKLKVSQKQKKAVIGIVLKDAIYKSSMSDEVLLEYFKQNISRYQNGENNNSDNSSDDSTPAINLNSTLNLTNQNNSETAPAIPLSEEEIAQQFATNQENVREDYLIENGDNIIANFKEDLSVTIEGSNLKGRVSQRNFYNLFTNNDQFNLQVIDSKFYNYFSQEIFDEQTNFPFISQRDIIKKMFLNPTGEISEVFEQGEFFYVALNYVEFDNDQDISSFVESQSAKQLEEEMRGRISQYFFNYLIKKNQEEIILLGQKLDL